MIVDSWHIHTYAGQLEITKNIQVKTTVSSVLLSRDISVAWPESSRHCMGLPAKHTCLQNLDSLNLHRMWTFMTKFISATHDRGLKSYNQNSKFLKGRENHLLPQCTRRENLSNEVDIFGLRVHPRIVELDDVFMLQGFEQVDFWVKALKILWTLQDILHFDLIPGDFYTVHFIKSSVAARELRAK